MQTVREFKKLQRCKNTIIIGFIVCRESSGRHIRRIVKKLIIVGS